MRHRRPGAVALLSIFLLLVLANGLPNVSGGATPSERWTDAALREQLRLDAKIEIIADANEFPGLIEEVRRARGRKKPVRPRPYVRDFRKLALKAARRANIRIPALFVRQMAAESGFQPCARSYAGALGIAQIMPATAQSWGVDPHIPEQALAAAAKHMARYERQLGSYRLALAAYNAGPGAVQQYGGVPPYAETREYIRRILDRSYPLPGMTQIFRTPSRMQSGFAHRLRALQRDVRRHGGRLTVNDGWRSYEDSMIIWKATKRKRGGWQAAKTWAAPPGCSNHVRGYAADLAGSLGLAHGLAHRHGLVFPMGHEPWHIEMRGISTQSG